MIVGWSRDEKRVIEAVEDYLEKRARVIVKIDLVESLLMPENFEVSLRYVLKHANYASSNIFQFFDTTEKPNHLVASRRRWLESQARDDARQESGRNEWYDFGNQGGRAKVPPCPNSTLQTPLPQQSLSSAREEENQWTLWGKRRRRRIVFENLAKSMLRYFDNCNEVKVGITELQERVEVPEQIGISIQQVERQAMNEDGQNIFEVFWQEEGTWFVASWARREGQDISPEIQMLNKRQDIFQNAIEGKLRDRASERLQDQIIEEIKELESTLTEEALQKTERA